MPQPGNILWRIARGSYQQARRIVIFVIGGSILLVGVVMFLPFVPGPGFVIIPIGLAVLAIEFAWARRALKNVKIMASNMQKKVANGLGMGKPQKPPTPTVPGES